MKKIILIFLTCAIACAANAQQAVDLGLSVKWGTCNIGASSPEQYGNYYAWAELSTKSIYSWKTYKWWDSSEETKENYSVTKYCRNAQYGKIDNKKVLEPEDDPAHAKLGGKWRTPTSAEWEELMEKCSWTWTKKNGISGYMVKSIKNGNSIFLPAAGHKILDQTSGAGALGFYWCSNLGFSYGEEAMGAVFGSSHPINRCFPRSLGQSVRAVCDK